MAIRIEMLGPPMLRGEGGEPLPFSAGKPFALLAYLAITRSRMARLVLAELLWGRATERSARASLRQAIFTIRRDIDPDLLVGDDPIGLDLDRFTTDVAEFRQHLVTGRAAAAAELWRGRFLEGLSVSGAPEFEHWSDGVAASLSRDLSAALQAEARALRSRGDAGGALRLLERAARLEPDSVGAQLRFAEALAEVGDRSALDILGAIDTGAIEADVAAECARLRGLLVGAAPSKPRSAAGDAMPFVGRRGELARMAEAWRGVRGGTAQVLAITGPAGIGKTRLAREFAAGIASGARLIEVRGVAVERPIPFGLIADLAGLLGRQPGARGITDASEAVLGSLLPSTQRRARPRSADSDERAIFAAALSDALHDLIGAVAYEGPLVITVDDLQWADPDSRAVLSRVCRHGIPGCLLLLIERHDNGPSTLVSDERWRIPLQPLSLEEIAELLGVANEDADADQLRVADQIRGITGGNPLFAMEAFRLLEEADVMVADSLHGRRLVGDASRLATVLPDTLRATVQRRITALSDAERRVVGTAASALESLSAETLRERSGLDRTGFRAAIDELLAREILVLDGPARFAIAHEEIRRVAAALLDPHPPRRAGLRTAVAVGTGVLGVLALAVTFDREERPGPFGGGTLWTSSRNGIYAIRADVRTGSFALTLAGPTAPPDAHFRTPLLTTSGELLWFGTQTRLDLPPYAVRLRNGVLEELHRGPGDVAVVGGSPDGRHLLLVMEDTAAPAYDTDLWRRDPDGSLHRILDTPSIVSHAAWSPDGARIAATYAASRDTVVVLRPDGERLAVFSFRDGGEAAWCEPSRLLVNAAREAGEPRAVWEIRLDRGAAEPRPVPLEFPVSGSSVACAPDGNAAAYLAIVDDTVRPVIQPFGDGRAVLLPDAPAGGRLVWLPDRLAPIVTEVGIAVDTSTLRRGERRRLGAIALDTEGRRTETSIHWRSSDPAIASIGPDGVLTANRAGRVLVFATAGGWPVDSVALRISEDMAPGALFRDPLESLDPAEWYEQGTPPVEPVRLADGPALRLNGDGQYHDGIISRRTFDAAAGLTVELDVALTLHHTQQQSFDLCLVRLAELPIAQTGGWLPQDGGSTCFRYPARENVKFDAGEARLSVPGDVVYIAVDPGRGDGSWHRYALQLQPDGYASILIDGAIAATSRLRLHGTAPVRVAILGKSRGTTLFVRDLVVWEGLRHPE